MQTLPLGIDVGEARVRVALAQLRPDGTPELVAVATRPRGENITRTITDAVTELRTIERRCVLGVGEPAAILRSAMFPPMPRAELERAARFEAAGLIDYPIADAFVRIVPLDASSRESALGVVRKTALAELSGAAHNAKLRVVAVDNNALGFHRALPEFDAVLDIGVRGSRLYVFGRGVPRAQSLRIGGAAFTQAIVDAFGTDDPTAERRKLAHGIAGSGEDLREALVESVAGALIDCRASGYGDVRRLALVGNGAKIDDLAASIERAAVVRVSLASFAPDVSQTLPPDVLRAAAPDWSLAYGLALWAVA